MYQHNSDQFFHNSLAVARVLLYFDCFHYPLTKEEIDQYIAQPVPSGVVDEMEKMGLVHRTDAYYMMYENPEWVEKRLDCNARAAKHLPLAARLSAFIGSFPFVRGVFISGSLSKNCMAADSDIDFFIITTPGRLWLARTLLVVFKKIFLFNSHKYFCVNYFIDTNHLEIEEKNLFTATETVTLIPLYGGEWYGPFMEANTWVKGFYPAFPNRETTGIPTNQRGFFKKLWEKLFSGSLGTHLDTMCLRITLRHWQKKFKHLEQETFKIALKSKKYVSKHHPLFFQKKVLDAYTQKVAQWTAAHASSSVEVMSAPDGNNQSNR